MRYFKATFTGNNGKHGIIETDDKLKKFHWKLDRTGKKVTKPWQHINPPEKQSIAKYWEEITEQEAFVEML